MVLPSTLNYATNQNFCFTHRKKIVRNCVCGFQLEARVCTPQRLWMTRSMSNLKVAGSSGAQYCNNMKREKSREDIDKDEYFLLGFAPSLRRMLNNYRSLTQKSEVIIFTNPWKWVRIIQQCSILHKPFTVIYAFIRTSGVFTVSCTCTTSVLHLLGLTATPALICYISPNFGF